jgi:riboflavin kinase/FMN adenylyltransferase
MGTRVRVKVLHGLETLKTPLAQSVLTVGNFDGVHRAHQQLLAQAGLFAANTGGPVVVLTFEPHPLSIVAPSKAPPRLSTADDKLHYLAKAGADLVVVARSEPALLNLEAEAFIEDILLEKFHPTHVVEGPSFGFGRGRKGTPELLRQVAGRAGCEVYILGPVTLQIDCGETLMVSSSMIRRLLTAGKVRRAGLCLGRAYTVTGCVVAGDGRGRSIGFPTANLEGCEQLIPGDGVYAGEVFVGEDRHPAAISIGHKPTFGGDTRAVEAYLLDFDGDLYGQPIRVAFHRRLRGQQKYESTEALVAQMERDVDAVRESGDPAASNTRRSEAQTE